MIATYRPSELSWVGDIQIAKLGPKGEMGQIDKVEYAVRSLQSTRQSTNEVQGRLV